MPDDEVKFKAPPRQFWPSPPIPDYDPYDDVINDERQWKGSPMFDEPSPKKKE